MAAKTREGFFFIFWFCCKCHFFPLISYVPLLPDRPTAIVFLYTDISIVFVSLFCVSFCLCSTCCCFWK
ncbi:hypothetical protein J3Q64DRAFT_1713461 [Phycomyces blakesleeanus]|uniref:Uncharacterized protein n=1 Tax=Phycomyces blakesleeanus TaxID=4837 RepID=A0ABR3BHW8_PHYBL